MAHSTRVASGPKRGAGRRQEDRRASGAVPMAEDDALAALRRELQREIEGRLAAEAASRHREALVQMIVVLGRTLERRAPYTAGHQQRVAALAVAIARAMHLPDDQVEGLRLGGLVHDIGKIYVPTEILAKSTNLSGPERILVQCHCEMGASLLDGIALPWSIRSMVLEHHERPDGSGYPLGLKGDRIALEARVLAVADTVEAMASQRAYRAALGIDAALDEIRQHRGVRYDAAVVDACVMLFREDGYDLRRSASA